MALRFTEEKRGIARFKEQIQNNSSSLLILLLIIALFLLGLFAYVVSMNTKNNEEALLSSKKPTAEILLEEQNDIHSIQEIRDESKKHSKKVGEEEKSNTAQTILIVHVDGAVNNPGVFQLRSDERVSDAVAAAGGLLNEADTKQVNLASKLEDGSKIYIPLKGESFKESESQSPQSSNGKININSASLDELCSIPGIGPKTAQAIIQTRAQEKFSSIEDLMRVDGIGNKKFEKLKEHICV